jgi:hypothetical protein
MTVATITPPYRIRAATASSRNSIGANPSTDSDSKPAARLKLDSRLESVRELIESQPTAIHTTLSDTAVAMLLSTKTLRDKRAGFVNLTMNETLIPRSCNIQVKLAFPKEMKDDVKTLENVVKWDDLIRRTREELKKKIIAQGERTIEFLEEKRQELFNERLLIISEGFTTWFVELEGVTETPLSNHAYAAACLYCHYNSLESGNALFAYLCILQDDLLAAFKKKYLTTAAGKPLFSNRQLSNITLLLPADDEFLPSSPLRVDPTPPITQDQAAGANADVPQPVPKELESVMYKVKDKLNDLIPKLFLDLILTVEMSHRELKANAKLEATLKKKKTLDLAKILEDDQAIQQVVAPENMKALVNTLVDQRIDHQGRQKQKALLKKTINEARKKSSGGTKTARTPPGKQASGGKQKGILRKVSFGTNPPPSKRAKKHSTQRPEQDYQALERQRRNPNPYATRPSLNNNNNTRRPPFHSGRGAFQGRGRGRGPARGGFNSGRGRGRGRF